MGRSPADNAPAQSHPGSLSLAGFAASGMTLSVMPDARKKKGGSSGGYPPEERNLLSVLSRAVANWEATPSTIRHASE